MAYIKFKRSETNEGSSLLLPVEGIITVKSASTTSVEIKYNTVVHTDATAPEVLSHTLTVAADGYIDGAAAVLTQDIIINNVISAIEKCGLDGGANATVANMKVEAQTIAGATL
jgi:hypothetical protein